MSLWMHHLLLHKVGMNVKKGLTMLRIGADKDLNKAFDLYLEASQLPGVPWFTYSNLGRYFLLGIGNVDASYDMAKEHFTKAKELG